MSIPDILITLIRIHEILRHHPGDSADWLDTVLQRT